MMVQAQVKCYVDDAIREAGVVFDYRGGRAIDYVVPVEADGVELDGQPRYRVVAWPEAALAAAKKFEIDAADPQKQAAILRHNAGVPAPMTERKLAARK